MTLTEILATLAIETPDAALGAEADNATRLLILDSLGTAIAGMRAPGVPEAVRVARLWGGTPEAPVWGYGARLPAPQAAFANSVMVHAMDYDDVHRGTALHQMSSLFPAVMALAEMRNLSGRAVMSAVALGVEVSARIAIAATARRVPDGYLPATTAGIFGTTAACCRCLGLDVTQTANALGIAYAQCSGNRQALLDHSLTKRLQPALAARSALWAASLAEQGVTGPLRALEGDAGFFPLYVRSSPPDAAEISAAGPYWQVMREWIKPYPSCGATHTSTHAAIGLAIAEDLQPEEIAEVHLDLGHSDNWFVGHPWRLGSDPQVDAQFSVRYAVALGLLRRRAGLSEYDPQRIVSDADVSDLAGRIQIHEIPGTEGIRTENLEVRVTVITRSGRALSHTGSWGQPMGRERVIAKFHECAAFSRICSATQADVIIALADHLEDLPRVAELVGALPQITEIRP